MSCSLKEAISKSKAEHPIFPINEVLDCGNAWLVIYRFPKDTTGLRHTLIYKETGEAIGFFPPDHPEIETSNLVPVDISGLVDG